MRRNNNEISKIWQSSRYLIYAQLIINIIFNSDRILLTAFCSGTAVTIFFIASAVGKTVSLVTSSFNSVIIGYLSKNKTIINIKNFRKLIFFSSLSVLLLSVLCLFASVLYAKLLYPDDYDAAKPFFYVANLAQILYFASGIFTTILLIYDKEKRQTQINLIYAIVFCFLVVGSTKIYGIWGYSIGLLVTNLSRFIIAGILCSKGIKKSEETK